jgi:hypothetical protein
MNCPFCKKIRLICVKENQTRRANPGEEVNNMIFLDEGCATISWDEAYQILVVEWKKGFIHVNEAQNVLDKALELYYQKGKGKWLADTGQLTAFSKQIEIWIQENWLPRATAAGVKSMAFVRPTSVLARMAISSLMSKIPQTELQTAYFDSQAKAREWLRSR